MLNVAFHCKQQQAVFKNIPMIGTYVQDFAFPYFFCQARVMKTDFI